MLRTYLIFMYTWLLGDALFLFPLNLIEQITVIVCWFHIIILLWHSVISAQLHHRQRRSLYLWERVWRWNLWRSTTHRYVTAFHISHLSSVGWFAMTNSKCGCGHDHGFVCNLILSCFIICPGVKSLTLTHIFTCFNVMIHQTYQPLGIEVVNRRNNEF